MKIILADSHGPVMGKDQTSANLSLLYLGSYLKDKADFGVDLKYIPQAKSDQFHLDLIENMVVIPKKSRRIDYQHLTLILLLFHHHANA